MTNNNKPDVKEQNKPDVKNDPELRTQEEPKPNTYTVKKGDTWLKIQEEVDLHWREIAKKNGIKRPYEFKVGQKLKV